MPVRYAIIGAGAVSDYYHVPGIRLDPGRARRRVRPERGAPQAAEVGLGPQQTHDHCATTRSPPIRASTR